MEILHIIDLKNDKFLIIEEDVEVPTNKVNQYLIEKCSENTVILLSQVDPHLYSRFQNINIEGIDYMEIPSVLEFQYYVLDIKWSNALVFTISDLEDMTILELLGKKEKLNKYYCEELINSLEVEYGNIEVTEKFIDIFKTGPYTCTLPSLKNFNDYFGDPQPGVVKTLKISFRDKVFEINENNSCLIKINFLENSLRKSVIYLCLNTGRECFDDYINSLNIVDLEIYYNHDAEVSYLNYADSGNIYIFRYHITASAFPSRNIFVLNTEQMSEPYRFSHIKQLSDAGYQILDYSTTNIKYLNDSGINSVTYLPYMITDGENTILKEYSTEFLHDVCVVSAQTYRRRRIVDQLLSLGVNVVEAIGWKEIRDQKIGQCRILLNIHFDDTFNIFEHIRCDRWVYAGKVVISEFSKDQEQLDIYCSIIWSSYDKLVETVISTLSSYNEISLRLYSNNSIEERRDILKKFIAHINGI